MASLKPRIASGTPKKPRAPRTPKKDAAGGVAGGRAGKNARPVGTPSKRSGRPANGESAVCRDGDVDVEVMGDQRRRRL